MSDELAPGPSDGVAHVVNGPDPALFTPEELAEHKRIAAIAYLAREWHAARSSLVRLRANPDTSPRKLAHAELMVTEAEAAYRAVAEGA